MIVRQLQRKVTDAVAHEQGTGVLTRMVRGVMIDCHGPGAHRAELIETRTEQAMAFIHRYVEATPEIVASLMDAASDAGLSDDFSPVFVAAEDYFMRAQDYIPDHLGLAGVTDDAYMVQSLVQRLCDMHHARTGTRLLSLDLTPANELMRRMIGEPVATALDATVYEILGLPDVQTARDRLEKSMTRLKMRMPQPYETELISGDDLNLHIGALAART
jgi:hypothetical protein